VTISNEMPRGSRPRALETGVKRRSRARRPPPLSGTGDRRRPEARRRRRSRTRCPAAPGHGRDGLERECPRGSLARAIAGLRRRSKATTSEGFPAPSSRQAPSPVRSDRPASDRSIILPVGQQPLSWMKVDRLCPDQARQWRSRRTGSCSGPAPTSPARKLRAPPGDGLALDPDRRARVPPRQKGLRSAQAKGSALGPGEKARARPRQKGLRSAQAEKPALGPGKRVCARPRQVACARPRQKGLRSAQAERPALGSGRRQRSVQAGGPALGASPCPKIGFPL
jgi:hypothetical protein